MHEFLLYIWNMPPEQFAAMLQHWFLVLNIAGIILALMLFIFLRRQHRREERMRREGKEKLEEKLANMLRR
jgi:hypothetical protein